MLLLLFLLITGANGAEEVTSTRPTLIFFTINHCEDCDAASVVWEELNNSELPTDILLDEVNCDFQDRTCHDYEITKLPSILFVSSKGIREFEDELSVENLLDFIKNSEAVIINGEAILTEEEVGILHITEENMDLLGKSHSLIYFMYDEELDHVEDFVLSVRARLSAQFNLPLYIIDCGTLTDVCVEEPFQVQILPCIKYFGESVHTYTGDFVVERIEYWLQVFIFKTKEPDVDDDLETITADQQKENSKQLVYINSESEYSNVAYMEGVLLAFYLTEENSELEDLFKLLTRKYQDNKDLQIFAIQCNEYNAPKACQQFPDLPTVQHGFMGRLVKELSLRTEEQFDAHIEKLLKILAEGGHILRRNLGKIFELTISNFGEQIHRYDVTFVYYYTSACGRCEECDMIWNDIHYLYANHPLILPGRVDCNFNRGTCKQAETRGSDVVVYYRGTYHSKFEGPFKYHKIVEFLETMYKSPPEGVFNTAIEDRIIDRSQEEESKDEKDGAIVKEEKGEVVEEAADTAERSGHALIITTENFNDTITNNRLVFIKFFVPWCGHCQKLKPVWKQLAHSFREVTDIVIGMVNCQNEQELCRKHLVHGYPTLFTFERGLKSSRYKEDRTLDAFISHIKEQYYGSVETDLKEDVPFTITKNNVWNVLGIRTYTMVMFTADNCEPCIDNHYYFQETWKAVKGQPALAEKIMLARVECNVDLELCKELEITQVPYIVLFDIDEPIDPSSAPTETILNPFKAVQSTINSSPRHVTIDTIAWHKKYSDIKQELEEEKKAPRKSAAHSTSGTSADVGTAHTKTEGVTELTTDTFKAQLKKSRFTFVKFYAPWCGHCRKLVPIWTELGDKFFLEQDIVIANVNCDAHESLCDKHKVTVFPTLYLYENDRKLKHTSKKRKIEDLTNYIQKFLASEPAPATEMKENSAEEVPAPGTNEDKKLSAVTGAVLSINREKMLELMENKEKSFIFLIFYYESQRDSTLIKLSDTWDRIAATYVTDTRIVFGRVDCDDELRLCVRYKSVKRDTYPQVFMFDKTHNSSNECLKRGEYDLIAYVEGFLESGTTVKDEL